MACASAAGLVAMAARYAGNSWTPSVKDADEAALAAMETLADADADA